MSVFEMKLPDVGEGVAEAELVSWMVEVGDEVTPDSVLAEVLTDKATVEVASPVTGSVVALHGEPGDVLAVGSSLVGIEVADGVVPEPATEATPDPEQAPEPAVEPAGEPASEPTDWPSPASSVRVAAAPAVRQRAADLGLDLGSVRGTGPGGRVVHTDLDRQLVGRARSNGDAPSSQETHEIPIRGVRRKIADRLSAAWSEIPHITYVESVDVTELEALRAELNRRDGEGRLTLLPFLARAIVVACHDQPEINALYDHAAETLTVVEAVHIGIATQTGNGLMVPVVRNADTRDLRGLAAEIGRVSEAARDGSASRNELSGSTITITSLGARGGVATTPILNPPEIAIVGVNKMEVRPVWRDGAFVPRQVLNLSSSFDHRMIDGWDAAKFIQRIRSLLEIPALLFVDE